MSDYLFNLDYALDFRSDTNYAFNWYYFPISFYLMEASFVDMAYLKPADILNRRVEYKRGKTGRLHSVLFTGPLNRLLDIYMNGRSKDDFILNVIQSDDPEKHIINIRDELRRFNRGLEELGKLCGIEALLT